MTKDIADGSKTKHISDGITYAGEKKWKCKNCKIRLTRDEYHNGECVLPNDNTKCE